MVGLLPLPLMMQRFVSAPAMRAISNSASPVQSNRPPASCRVRTIASVLFALIE